MLAKQTYVEEFPFLERIFPKWRDVGGIEVQRIDVVLLNYVPAKKEVAGIFGNQVNIYFIGKDGADLGEVRQSVHGYTKFSLMRPLTWFPCWIKEGESVAKALIRLDDKIKELTYIVVVIENACGQIIVYKLPKNFSLEEFLAEEKERIRMRIHMA